jgi:hypothetical protein
MIFRKRRAFLQHFSFSGVTVCRFEDYCWYIIVCFPSIPYQNPKLSSKMKQKLVIIASVLTLTLSAMPEAGAQWVQTSVPSRGRCFAALGTYLFAGTESSGVFRSTDNGSTWQAVNTGLPNIYIGSLLASGTCLFAGTGSRWSLSVGSGIFLSTDSGKSWRSLNAGLPNSSVNALTISGTLMFAGTQSGVFRSSDSGNSWIAADSGLEFTDINDTNINAILVEGLRLLAGGSLGVFLSTDSGSIWTTSWSTNGDIHALAAMDSNLFAGLNDGGIFRSTNGGSTWIATGWTSKHVQAFWVIGTNLFAATQEGAVILSTDSGANWSVVSGNLPRLDAFSLMVVGPNMYVGTGVGVSWIPLLQLLALAAVTPTAKSQPTIVAYPNPLTQSTTITFSSPESGVVEVTIVNLLGSQVKRIFSGELEAGAHSFEWDAGGMPPGMYECIVRMNGHIQTTPIVLER